MKTFIECLVLFLTGCVALWYLYWIGEAICTHPEMLNVWWKWIACITCESILAAGVIISFGTLVVIVKYLCRRN